jgi:hypothetical protein
VRDVQPGHNGLSFFTLPTLVGCITRRGHGSAPSKVRAFLLCLSLPAVGERRLPVRLSGSYPREQPRLKAPFRGFLFSLRALEEARRLREALVALQEALADAKEDQRILEVCLFCYGRVVSAFNLCT